MFKIRNYQERDYDEIVLMLSEASLFDSVWDSKENLKSMVIVDPNSVLVAELDNEVIGSLYLIPFGNNVSYLFRLVVNKKYRKQGVAIKLINYAREILKKRNKSELGLYVDAGNEDLISFYKKRGFKASSSSYYYMWEEL